MEEKRKNRNPKGTNRKKAGQGLSRGWWVSHSDEQSVVQPDIQYSREGPIWNICL